MRATMFVKVTAALIVAGLAATVSADTSHGGMITSDETWLEADNPHIVTSQITIDEFVTVTLQPGVRVYFPQYVGMTINGTLMAEGTQAKRIFFTSRSDTSGGSPAPGHWYQLRFNQGSSATRLAYCIIRYGGRYAWNGVGPVVNSVGGSPEFSTCRVYQNAAGAFECSGAARPVIADCSILDNAGDAFLVEPCNIPHISFSDSVHLYVSNNHGNGIRVKAGTIGCDAVWQDLGPCYWVSDGNLVIGAGASLTLRPGVVLKLYQYRGLTVNGKLVVDGSPDSLVYITSYRDDIRQDTDGNGSSSGQPGDWHQVAFTSCNDASEIAHCVVRFGGRFAWNGTGPVIDVCGCDPHFQDCVLSNNEADVFRVFCGSRPIMHDCVISSNGGDAYYIDLESLPDLQFSGQPNDFVFANHGNGIKVTGGTMNTDTEWPDRGLCYWLADADLTIDSAATLTLQEGVGVKLGQYRRLVVNGTLLSQGVPGNQVHITSYRDDGVKQDTDGSGASSGVAGDWYQILFGATSDNSVLEHTVIRYGGRYAWNGTGAAVSMSSATPRFEDCRISNNEVDAIQCFAGSNPLIKNCFVHNNGGDAYYVDLVSFPDLVFVGDLNNYVFANIGNGIRVTGGTLGSSAVWRDMGPCYWLADADLTVPIGISLTLDPGVIVKLSSYRGIVVDGTLDAEGEADRPIYLTSYRDDIRQDTDGAGFSAGSSGDWYSLTFGATSSASSLRNCIVRYGGRYAWNGVGPAISVTSANPQFECCSFSDCVSNKHILCASSARPVISHCDFVGGPTVTAVENTDVTGDVTASDCFWGHPTGPYDPTDTQVGPPDYNPNGQGCRVSDHVAYRPWSSLPMNDPLDTPELAQTERVDSVLYIAWHPVIEAVEYDVWICRDTALQDTVALCCGLCDTAMYWVVAAENEYLAKVRARGHCWPGEWSPWSALIETDCCVGKRGNYDASPDDAVDLSDLTILIDHLFISLSPLWCWEEGNLDESLPEGPESVSLGDLTIMIDFLFVSMNPLPPCPARGMVRGDKTREPSADVVINWEYVDGFTTITLSSNEALRAVELRLTGIADIHVPTLFDDRLNVIHGCIDEKHRIGIVDLDGEEIITAGEHVLLSIPGQFAVTEAYICDRQHRDGRASLRETSASRELPVRFELAQNYPNPFNPTTDIEFSLPRTSEVQLEVFNIAGQRVMTLINDVMSAGRHRVTWDARGCASGVYFYRLSTAEFTSSRKMLLLK